MELTRAFESIRHHVTSGLLASPLMSAEFSTRSSRVTPAELLDLVSG